MSTATPLFNTQVPPDGLCQAARELLDALMMTQARGNSENKLLVEMSGSHNVHCSEKLFIPYISKSKLVSWVFTVTSSALYGPWCQLKKVFMLDPFLPEFSITNVSVMDKPIHTLPSNSQEWNTNFKEPASEYKVTVQFVSGCYGNFYQRLVFDFGSGPKVVRSLGVIVAPEQSLVKQLTYKIPCAEENELVWLSKYQLVTYDGKVDDGKSKSTYPLPPNIKNALEYGSFDHMDDELSTTNYRDRLHTLLFVEEYERRKQMTRLNLHTDDILQCTQPSVEYVVRLNVILPVNPDILEDANHLISRSSFALIKLIPPGKKIAKLFEVTVEALKKDSVVFLTSQSLERVIEQAKSPLPADVCFRFVDTYQFMHKAIDNVDLHVVFPFNRSGLSLDWEVEKHSFLNKPQATALSHILDPRPKPPLLMFGPFGTGKTRTIAEAVKELCRLHSGNPEENLRILICTHSNSAADHYIVDYLDPFVTSKKSGSFLSKPLRICWENRFIKSISSTVLKYCFIDKKTGRFAVPDKKVLDKYRVVVTTLVTADVLVELGLPAGYFSHVFIDEAAQAMEAESLIPLCLAHPSTRIVLAGDHLQLGAIVSSSVARRLALDRSLLVRLYDFYPRKSNCKLLLLENYRAYKDIVDIPSKLFYEGTLVAHKTRPPSSEYPIHFHGVLGKEARAPDIGSYFNMAEAAEICERVEELIDKWSEESDEEVVLENICVLAPYTAQIREIRQLLRKKKLSQVRVEGVNNVQGLEFDAVFISTVHTSYSMSVDTLDREDLGFLSDPRLLNTAVTRAKYHLAVVGEPSALCGAGACKACWKTILSKCDENGTFYYRLSFDKVIEYTKFNSIDQQSTMNGPSNSTPTVPLARLVNENRASPKSTKSTPASTPRKSPSSPSNTSPSTSLWNSGASGPGISSLPTSVWNGGASVPGISSPPTSVWNGGASVPGISSPPTSVWNGGASVPGISSPPTSVWNGGASVPTMSNFSPNFQPIVQRPVVGPAAGLSSTLVYGKPPLIPSRPPGNLVCPPGQLPLYSGTPAGYVPRMAMQPMLPTSMVPPSTFRFPGALPLGLPTVPMVATSKPGQVPGPSQFASQMFSQPPPQMTGQFSSPYSERVPGPNVNQPNFTNPNTLPFQYPWPFPNPPPGQVPVQKGSPGPSQDNPFNKNTDSNEISQTQNASRPDLFTPVFKSSAQTLTQQGSTVATAPDPVPTNQVPPENPGIRSYAQVASQRSTKDERNVPTVYSGHSVSQAVQNLTYNIHCRKRILLEEEKWLLELCADQRIGKSVVENAQNQLKVVEDERRNILRRSFLNEAIARQLNVDCSIASNAAKMWSNSFDVRGRNEPEGKDSENDGEDEFGSQELSSSTDDAKSHQYEEFNDSDTEEWFQSRRDDPLVKEYIKAFESLVEAFSLDFIDNTQNYQANEDEEFPSDMVPFGTMKQPPNWLVEPNNAVSYIGNVIHQEYMDEGTVRAKLLQNELLLCTLEISNSSGGRYGYAKVLDLDIKAMLVGIPKEKIGAYYEEHPDILISNRSDMNRALNGDIVVVEILKQASHQLRGRVVFLYREVHCREYVCFVDLQDSNTMMPVDKTNPSVFVLQSKDHRGEIGVAVFAIKDGETRCQEFVTETSGKLFLVRLLEWGANYRLPLGVVRKCFREASDLNTAVPVFAAEYGIRLNQPAEVLNEVKRVFPETWKIPDAELTWRSHRYTNAFTLDCSSSTGIELDDALSIKKDGSGNFDVGIHVADVSYFIPKDSCIDQAAYLQGSSVYPDQENGPSINMLPRRLSQDLCSLLPGQERLAVSVVFKLDSEGKMIKQPDIHRSVVVSCCCLSFKECDDILVGDSKRKLPGSVEKDLLFLSKLTRKIAARQARLGCIAAVSGDGVYKTGSKSSQIIEQLMVMTNSAVAQKILLTERTKHLAPLRRQMPPKTHLLESFNHWCKENGVLQSGSLSLRRLQEGTTHNDAIKDMKIELSCLGHISTAINANNITQLTEALLKCDDVPLIIEARSRLCLIQEKSQYIVSSSSQGVQLKHFTLGLECYTHFSSPLRRYFDLVVHRCLLALIYDEELPYSERELQKICFNCQVTSGRASAFEKNCSSTKLASSLRSSPKWRTAKIERVSPDSITSICRISDNSKPVNICTKVQDLRPAKTEFILAEKELVLTWKNQESNNPQHLKTPPYSKSDSFYAKIPSASWSAFVFEVARSNLKKANKEWKKINSSSLVVDHNPSLTNSNIESDVTGALPEMQIFTNRFRVNNPIQVLFGSEKRRGVLQPDVQGVHVMGNGFCCTGHQRNPDTCFCPPLTFPTLPFYVDEQHYQGVMIPLLEAEAAATVLDPDSKRFVIKGVNLTWTYGPGSTVTTTLKLPQDEQRTFQLAVGDYACVRSLDFPSTRSEEETGDSEYNILLHARVTHVTENNDQIPSIKIHTLQLVDPLNGLSAEILSEARLYVVECIPQSQRFRVMIQAVKNLYQASEAIRSVVLHQDLPSIPQKIEMSTLKGFPLDIDQAEAVKAALSLPLTVIHGQPGTGKTWTAVAIICHFINKNWHSQGGKVLVCAPTNKALDALAKMLVKVPAVKILRVYSREVESEALNSSQCSTESAVIRECEPVALHMRVRSADNPNANALLMCIREIDQLQQKIEESKKKGKDHADLVKKLTSRKLKYIAILDAAERFEITETSVHVLLCTCVEAANPRMRKFARVTQCIVDESNMCLDAELLVPLVAAGPRCDHVVMIGDQRELVPVLRSKSAKKLGLGRSLFESLCEHHEGKKYACCLLRMQFRMHPSIRIFSSEYFYTGKPVFDAPEITDSIIRMDGFWPNRQDVRHVFCHVNGKEHMATCMSGVVDGDSCRFNPAEINKIVQIVDRLLLHGIEMKYITIITPFLTQRAHIKDALSHQAINGGMKIISPQEAQGCENAFVIFSTVRSKSRDQNTYFEHAGKIGCLGDANQMNVALTRSRLGLIILGDMDFLRSIPLWNRLLCEYESRDCLVDGLSWP